jgi:DNA-binding CsgD family transcriptional regulator
MEVQVANLVKAGRRNQEIASILGISLNTVMTHRYLLRSKLGLKQKKVNLRSYLNSTDF